MPPVSPPSVPIPLSQYSGGLALGRGLLSELAGDLLHHCQILELDGNSYRNPPRRPRATPAPPADDEAFRTGGATLKVRQRNTVCSNSAEQQGSVR